jgi:hypothetical protein
MLIGVNKEVKFLSVLILFTVMSICLLTYEFFSYSIVTRESIISRDNVFRKQVNYKLEDINNISVSAFIERIRRKNRIVLYYTIYTNDGKTIELNESKEFWEKIVDLDKYLESKGLKIKRQKIDLNTMIMLGREYGFRKENGIDDVIDQIFIVEKSSDEFFY